MFGHSNEPFTLERDVSAVIIPAGESVTLRAGTSGFITQALGGSFTVYLEGNLFRISGADADALGKEPVPPPAVPDNPTDKDIEAVIWNQLKTCYDPEIPVNIVDLGLVYRCEISGLPDHEFEKAYNKASDIAEKVMQHEGDKMDKFLEHFAKAIEEHMAHYGGKLFE